MVDSVAEIASPSDIASGVTTGAWTNVDLTSLVTAGTKAVAIHIINDSGGSADVGLRMDGSAWTETVNLGNTYHHHWIVGLDTSTDIIEIYQSAEVQMFINVEFGPDWDMELDPSSVTGDISVGSFGALTLSNYTTNTPTNATAAIIMGIPNGSREYDSRPTGATGHTFRTDGIGWCPTLISVIDGSGQWDMASDSNSAGWNIYVLGWTDAAGWAQATSRSDLTPTYNAGWTSKAVPESGATFALLEMRGATHHRTLGGRKPSATDNTNYTDSIGPGGNMGAGQLVPVSSGNIEVNWAGNSSSVRFDCSTTYTPAASGVTISSATFAASTPRLDATLTHLANPSIAGVLTVPSPVLTASLIETIMISATLTAQSPTLNASMSAATEVSASALFQVQPAQIDVVLTHVTNPSIAATLEAQPARLDASLIETVNLTAEFVAQSPELSAAVNHVDNAVTITAELIASTPVVQAAVALPLTIAGVLIVPQAQLDAIVVVQGSTITNDIGITGRASVPSLVGKAPVSALDGVSTSINLTGKV